MRTVIGLCGYAQSGKDTAANALIEQRGFVKVAFADPLREAMAALNPIVGERFEYGLMEVKSVPVRYNEALETYGYNEAKQKFPEVRRLLQVFGTEVGRQQFSDTFWTDLAIKKINALPQYQPVVITDVRFPNEVSVIRDFMGIVVRITRPGVDAVNQHVSDTNVASLNADIDLVNRGTVEDLHRMICQVADSNALFGNVEPTLFTEDDSWAV